MALQLIDAPTGLAWSADEVSQAGQGGVAGFGKGSADVALTPISVSTTKLAYNARATVGGKMAQIGSRLIDATASKITDDFFKAFEAQLQARAPMSPTALPTVAEAALPRQPTGTLGWVLAGLVVLATLYVVFR